MKKLKLFTDIEQSYHELVYKVSWPTRSQLISSSVLVMIASIIISIIILIIDLVFKNVMDFIYAIG
ncbi:MAG: preprotein translocase subunit SecE [Muribaculaceae bacterium]|nr:preprotein translocase subunit SecE [Muribaculaceae bacterium]